MASRKADKEAARERRLQSERAIAAQAQRLRRLRMLGAVLVGAVVVVVVLVLVSGGAQRHAVTDPHSSAARSVAGGVDRLLAGIPEHGVTLGDASAPVTITEFGDLECPYCADFARGAQAELIAHEVRAGKVKLVYRSLETATGGGPDASLWPLQQAAAYAAGGQDRAWYYIELFYREQGAEDSGYATTPFLQSIARQVPGLDYARWNSERFAPTFHQRVIDDAASAAQLGIRSTPTVFATRAGRRTRTLGGATITDGQLQAMVSSVAR